MLDVVTGAMKDTPNDGMRFVFDVLVVVVSHSLLKALMQDKLQCLPAVNVLAKHFIVAFGSLEVEALAPVATIHGYADQKAAILPKDAKLPSCTQ